jgi:hypothetical protein
VAGNAHLRLGWSTVPGLWRVALPAGATLWRRGRYAVALLLVLSVGGSILGVPWGPRTGQRTRCLVVARSYTCRALSKRVSPGYENWIGDDHFVTISARSCVIVTA